MSHMRKGQNRLKARNSVEFSYFAFELRYDFLAFFLSCFSEHLKPIDFLWLFEKKTRQLYESNSDMTAGFRT